MLKDLLKALLDDQLYISRIKNQFLQTYINQQSLSRFLFEQCNQFRRPRRRDSAAAKAFNICKVVIRNLRMEGVQSASSIANVASAKACSNRIIVSSEDALANFSDCSRCFKMKFSKRDFHGASPVSNKRVFSRCRKSASREYRECLILRGLVTLGTCDTFCNSSKCRNKSSKVCSVALAMLDASWPSSLTSALNLTNCCSMAMAYAGRGRCPDAQMEMTLKRPSESWVMTWISLWQGWTLRQTVPTVDKCRNPMVNRDPYNGLLSCLQNWVV